MEAIERLVREDSRLAHATPWQGSACSFSRRPATAGRQGLVSYSILRYANRIMADTKTYSGEQKCFAQ